MSTPTAFQGPEWYLMCEGTEYDDYGIDMVTRCM